MHPFVSDHEYSLTVANFFNRTNRSMSSYTLCGIDIATTFLPALCVIARLISAFFFVPLDPGSLREPAY